MSDAVQLALIATFVPTLTIIVGLWQQSRTRKRDKEEAIAARERIEDARQRDKAEAMAARAQLVEKVNVVKDKVEHVEVQVNGKSDETKAEVAALKKEIARVNREGTPTPAIEAGQGAPGEVGIDHGVVSAEREGPFPPKSGSRE